MLTKTRTIVVIVVALGQLSLSGCVSLTQPGVVLTSTRGDQLEVAVTDTPWAQPTATVDPLTNNLPALLTHARYFSLGNLSTSEQANVYATVIRRLVGPDDTFGGHLPKPVIYILTTTNDQVGDFTLPTAEPQGISSEVQYTIQALTTDLSGEIRWVAHRDEVRLDSRNGKVIDGGVILTLGNILVGDDQKSYVAGSVYFTDTAAGGQTYVFELRAGQWVLIGTTNTIWIS